MLKKNNKDTYDYLTTVLLIKDGKNLKKGDVIAGYIVIVTYPGHISRKRSRLKFSNVIDGYKNEDGNTVITYAWKTSDFVDPKDSLHAAEMFHSTMVTRVSRNANSHIK